MMATGNVAGHIWGLDNVLAAHLMRRFQDQAFLPGASFRPILASITSDATSGAASLDNRIVVDLVQRRGSCAVWRIITFEVAIISTAPLPLVGCDEWVYERTTLLPEDHIYWPGTGCDPLCEFNPMELLPSLPLYILSVAPPPQRTAPRSFGWEYAIAIAETDTGSIDELWAALYGVHTPDSMLWDDADAGLTPFESDPAFVSRSW